MKIAPQLLSVAAVLTLAVPLPGQNIPQSIPRDAAGGSNPAGRAVYERHCAACHGANGGGDGAAAVWLYPKPRDFSSGLFKIKSTPGQALPTDADLLASVTRGLPGSSMPSFSYLSELERRDVVEYLKTLAVRTNASGIRTSLFAETAAVPPVPVPPEPPVTVQELARGREIYQKMSCFTCHGETGAGDGPQVPLLKDAAGLPIRPRDFNTGLFRGGHTGPDLYLRIHNGMPGTPMVPYGETTLTPEERWAVVHFVQSLRRTEVAVNDLLTPDDAAIRVRRVSALATNPMDAAWEKFDPVRVPLNPLWPEPNQVYAVAVSAMTDGKRIAILLQWRDELPRGDAIRVQDFQDAAALQFSLSGNYGFLGMGDAANPVNIWQWKAGWEADAQGRQPDVHDVYNSMHSDTYFATSYQTAVDAGNVIAQPHRFPIEDANARGFGSFRSQPMPQQNVQGKGVWHDGFWNVVFVRDLKSRDADDVKFTSGKAVPVALAIWNGEQHDRNGRKMVSNWFHLLFENEARAVKRGTKN